MTDTSEQAYEGFALVELLGHRRSAGMLTVVEMAGIKMLRIDTPDPSGEDGKYIATQFYPPGALYCISSSDKATVLEVVNRRSYVLPEPVQLQLTSRAKQEAATDAVEYRGEDSDDDDDVVF